MDMMPNTKKIKLIDPEEIKKRREEKEAKEKENRTSWQGGNRWSQNYARRDDDDALEPFML